MTTEEDDHHAEALRRIQEAEQARAAQLDLSTLFLKRLPPELERLSSLQTLNLSGCGQLSGDLSPLAGLSSLQTLNLSYCGQLSGDLSPLAGLSSLQTLNLSYCRQLSGDLSPLAGLSSLQTLNLSYCMQLSGDLSPAGRSQLAPDARPLRMPAAQRRLIPAGKSQFAPGAQPLLVRAAQRRLIPAGKSRFAPGARPLLVQAAQRRLIPAGRSQFAPDAQALPMRAAQRRFIPAGKSQTLNLSGCGQLSGDLSLLAGLSSLQMLDLSFGMRLSGDLSPLAGLSSLQALDLSFGEQLSGDLSPVAGLSSLQTLDLSQCGQLSGDLSPLESLSSLQALNLSSCGQLSGDLSPLESLSSLQTLDLSYCRQLSDLSPLAGLSSLQTLDLSRCGQLSDLSPLAGLSSLQTLDLSQCGQLSDLSPLAGLSSLQELDLSGCTGVEKFAPLQALVPRLQSIHLFGCRFDDLPAEVCGENDYQNVIDEVRTHLVDLQSGQFCDAELKLFVLGNGGVGKTQLSRRLRNLRYDPQVPTTHGIELNVLQTTVNLENFQGPVSLNLWDFGGQDIYHGSHTLFLHGQAIFCILWTPPEQAANLPKDSAQRPLAYWLDYLRAVASADSSVIIVQSQCDAPDKRADTPVMPTKEFDSWFAEASAKTDFGLDRLKGTLQNAVWACLQKRPRPPIGKSRVAVRDRLREMLTKDQQLPSSQRQHRLLEREEFDRLCAQVGGVSDAGALLKFLHHNGVLFYREGLFKGRIVLDQNWALEAIYAIFDRKKILPRLQEKKGRFDRKLLEELLWSDYTPAEQKVFLGMMENCGICFRARRLSNEEWEYIAPELLPTRSGLRDELRGRIPKNPSSLKAEAHYPFLHEGILREYLSKIGQHANDAPIYWKYGCWFYEETTDSRVVIDSQWEDASETGPGTIYFEGWGERVRALLEPLIVTLQRLPVGKPPEIVWPADSKQVDRSAQISAWAEWIAWKLEEAGYSTVIQAWDFRPGTNFVLEMQQAASTADRTIAVLSQKYLKSAFTPEWAAAFAQDPQGRKQKLIPIRIAPCELTGILAPINYLDLVGLREEDARAALLGAFSKRNKPSSAPAFPGAITPPKVTPGQPSYPGINQTTAPPVTESLANLVESSAQNRPSRLSAIERLEFVRQLNAILPQHFNMLVVAVKPEPGFVPPMPAPKRIAPLP